MHALVPIKKLDHAKQRLTGALNAKGRRELFMAMSRDVLSVLNQHLQIDTITLLSNDPFAHELSRVYGCQQLSEIEIPNSSSPHEQLNSSLQNAVQSLASEGCKEVLVIHADLPLICDADINALINEHFKLGPDAISLVTDRHAIGTNAVVCNATRDFQFNFGEASRLKHEAQAARIGSAFQTLSFPGIACDIDRPEDLYLLAQQIDDSRAEHTQRFLSRHQIGLNDGLDVEKNAQLGCVGHANIQFIPGIKGYAH